MLIIFLNQKVIKCHIKLFLSEFLNNCKRMMIKINLNASVFNQMCKLKSKCYNINIGQNIFYNMLKALIAVCINLKNSIFFFFTLSLNNLIKKMMI